MAKLDWVDKELARYAGASAEGRRAAQTEPRAAEASFSVRRSALRIVLTNGAVLAIPVRLIRGLDGAPQQALRDVEVLGNGGGLHWESLDLDLSVPALVAAVLAGPAWMAELGRIGGQKSSAAKAAAARRNGRKGGRPRAAQARGSASRRPQRGA